MVDYDSREEITGFKWGQFCANLTTPDEIKGSKKRQIEDIQINQEVIFILDKSNKLFAIGGSEHGLLGLSHDTKSVHELTQIPDREFKSISLGDSHVLAITTDGQLMSWGANSCGQLGIGDLQRDLEYIPVMIETVEHLRFIQVIAVENSSFALTHSGDVYSWGNNAEGILGHDHKNSPTIPTKIETLNNIKKITVSSQIAEDSINGLRKNYQIAAIKRPIRGSRRVENSDDSELDSGRTSPKRPNIGKPSPVRSPGVMSESDKAGLGRQTTYQQIADQATSLTRQQTSSVAKTEEERKLLSKAQGVMDDYANYLKCIPEIQSIYQRLLSFDDSIMTKVQDEENNIGVEEERYRQRIDMNQAAQEISGVSEELIRLNADIQAMTEYNTKPIEKRRLQIMVRLMNDAISLRKINFAAAKMKVYHSKLKDNSFLSIREFIQNKQIKNIPSQVVRSRCKLRTVKIGRKLASNGENFLTMHSGLSELSSNTLIYIIDALATEADLWAVVNNGLANMTEASRAEQDEVADGNLNLIDTIWGYYAKIQSTNIDRLIQTIKYEENIHGSFNAYCGALIEKIDKKLNSAGIALENFGKSKKRPLQQVPKRLITALIENIELRKLMNDMNRKVFKKDQKDLSAE